MSAPAEQLAVHVCGPCGEKIEARPLHLFAAMQTHKKFCTPKKKRARPVEREHYSSPLRSQSYTGRTFLARMELVIAARRIQTAEDARAVDALVNEGGKP